MSGLPRRAKELLRLKKAAERRAQRDPLVLGDLFHRITPDEAIDEDPSM